MRTLRLRVACTEAEAPAALAALEAAFEADGAPVSVYETRQDGPWIAEALVPAPVIAGSTPPAERARAALSAAGLPEDVAVDDLEERDWVREGLAFLKPVRAGRFLLFGAHDRARVPPARGNLLVDAGSAFGTGHHATTLGCLLALDALLKRGVGGPVLDVGTGTGVLAIAAVRGGLAGAIATDIDPVAVAVARRNASIAGALHRIRLVSTDGVRHRTVRAGAPFGLVFANILARPLITLAPDLAPLVGPGGRLVLAGFRSPDERRVVAPYLARGLVRSARRVIDDWPTVVLARP